MPLPAARHAVPYVGTARDQGSRAVPCAHPQVSGLLWRCQPGQRQVRPIHVREIRCSDVRGVSEETVAASHARQAHGDCARQRPVPPRHPVGPFAQKIPRSPDFAIPAAIQPAVGAHRTSLEIDSAHGNAQPLLCNSGRGACRSRHLLQPVAKCQSRAPSIMRHYLRRYV